MARICTSACRGRPISTPDACSRRHRIVDPGYARSYAGLARTFQEDWRYRWTDTPELGLERAITLAQRSIELDPADARGHAAFGYACLFKRRHDESLAAYQRATELNPNDADVLAETGACASSCGDPQRGLQLLERAMRLNPFYPDWYLWNLGEVQFDLGKYQDAIQTLSQMRDKGQGYRLLAASHALLGHRKEARHYAKQVLIAQPGFSLEHWREHPARPQPGAARALPRGLAQGGSEVNLRGLRSPMRPLWLHRSAKRS